ncbi:hypothetical protein DPMN_176674 [Dreissena polymorpha]|uniref:EGF-like domain-containing protein n=1 Tax=Dreissena polymorpha TaxID=45954 RepID=A0A9D4E9J2_DREPO|nr:hypothetical protein DPMN_176674 [Dreissena polymorpha]
MIPSGFLVAVVFLSCFYIVRCNVNSPCNATVACANNITVCENGFCHIQAGQVCTLETTPTVATTVTTPSQVSSSTSATTTTVATTTTAATTTPLPGPVKRRRRSANQQECVSNASCVPGLQPTLVCACNDGYKADNGKCNKDPDNGAGHVRVTELFSVMVTTVLLFLI